MVELLVCSLFVVAALLAVAWPRVLRVARDPGPEDLPSITSPRTYD